MTSRSLAAGIIHEVLEKEGKSNLLLNACFREHPELTAADRHFVTVLVRGTVQKALWLDARLREVSSVPPEKMKPWVRTVLRMGLYQLLCLDKVPASAACNESVKLMKQQHLDGLSGFVNGVLRGAARKTDWKLQGGAERYSMPLWLWKRLVKDLGKEAAAEAAAAFEEAPKLTVRVNTARISPEDLTARLAEEGYDAEPSALLSTALYLKRRENVPSLPLEETSAIRGGLAVVQDVSSQLAVGAAAPHPGDAVLDLCAAPGGKTLHAADLMKNEGSILACDLTDAKTALLKENAQRNAYSLIRIETADASVYDPRKEGRFDLVIADLPCSGLGVIGRKPEIKYRLKPEDISALAALQRSILENALRYVKPGGKLLFSTCTLTKEENADNAAFLVSEGSLRPLPLKARVPAALADAVKDNTLQLIPGRFGTDGFFISLFEKI